MASRHEEKYIIDYRDYALLLHRARQLLTPDPNSADGSYVITSLYLDDPYDHALLEKLGGLPEHRKFRIRTYDFSDSVIKLERKDKHGVLTKKATASLTPQQLPLLLQPEGLTDGLSPEAAKLAAQIRSDGLREAVTVRYKRDAFTFAGSDLRLTFDTCLEAIRPDPQSLFDPNLTGVPVLGPTEAIMEIKYGSHCPAFIRMLTDVSATQLSVSKYALCREALI